MLVLTNEYLEILRFYGRDFDAFPTTYSGKWGSRFFTWEKTIEALPIYLTELQEVIEVDKIKKNNILLNTINSTLILNEATTIDSSMNTTDIENDTNSINIEIIPDNNTIEVM